MNTFSNGCSLKMYPKWADIEIFTKESFKASKNRKKYERERHFGNINLSIQNNSYHTVVNTASSPVSLCIDDSLYSSANGSLYGRQL